MRLPTAIAANAALIRKATRLRFGTAMAMSIAQLANFTLPAVQQMSLSFLG